MTPPDDPTPEDVRGSLAALRNALQVAERNAGRADLSYGWLRMWTGTVRTRLRAIYGTGSTIDQMLDLSTATPPPREKVPALLAERMSQIERFLEDAPQLGERIFGGPLAQKIFIGHGRSAIWRELKDFIRDDLSLPCAEFNSDPVAGITTFDRLSTMLDEANFALLVMTAEDEHADNLFHARENVVHEIGLFQGRLGPRRAIILQEIGCAEFSNIHGLTVIRFPSGVIRATFEDVRKTLKREGILSG